MSSASPPRNFTLTTEERLRAIVAGPPAWSLRKRRIEEMERALAAEVTEHGGTVAFGRKLSELNALIEKHNRYYPIEANLPFDLRGRLLENGAPWRPLALHTEASLLALASPAEPKEPDEEPETAPPKTAYASGPYR